MNLAVISHGFSEAAQYIDDETQRDRRYLHKSSAFGIESVLRDALAEVWAECQQPNWDGHDALPVSQDALRNMYMFLEALPLGIRRPTIGADPNGQLSAEWHRNPRRVLSLSISSDGLMHYAALLGSNKTCGTETFFGETPEIILSLIRRVYS
ncbi:MAG: hypothetical protein ABIG44_05020 [Planctomycetota bacterium]